MTERAPLSPSTRQCLAAGIRLFNQGLFWEAHEAWEEAWLAEDGLTKLWLQGLIQFTAAFHKGLRMGSPAGMARLFEQATEKFEHVLAEGDVPGGLDTRALATWAREGQQMATEWQQSGQNPWTRQSPVLLPGVAF